jgi:hypothetical protein
MAKRMKLSSAKITWRHFLSFCENNGLADCPENGKKLSGN